MEYRSRQSFHHHLQLLRALQWAWRTGGSVSLPCTEHCQTFTCVGARQASLSIPYGTVSPVIILTEAPVQSQVNINYPWWNESEMCVTLRVRWGTWRWCLEGFDCVVKEVCYECGERFTFTIACSFILKVITLTAVREYGQITLMYSISTRVQEY